MYQDRLEAPFSEGAVVDFNTGAGPVISQNALAYYEAGLCVLPTPLDGSKCPAGKWGHWKSEMPPRDMVEEWFAGNDAGICLLAGPVSGHVEALDFDDHGGNLGQTFQSWRHLVEELCPGLYGRLYVGQTPGGGYRVAYRCPECPGPWCVKLAMATEKDCLIESLSDGHIVMIPGGHPEAHPSGRPYTTVQGDLCDLPVLTAAERAVLVESARALDRRPKAGGEKDDWDGREPGPRREAGPASGTRPGDEFNTTATWDDVLVPHDWTLSYESGGMGYWCRPGKDGGVSATTNYADVDLLHVFSANAHPLEPDKSYSKFAAYALLNHKGDYAEAARDLAAKGYGNSELRTLAASEPAPGVRSIEDAWRFVPSSGLIPEYLKWVLPSTDAPPVFHVAAALGLAGHLLNRRVWLPTGHGRLHPNLWLALIAESSKQRKSTAIEPPLRLLRDDPAFARTLLPKAFSMEAMFSCLGHVLGKPEDIGPHRKKCRELDSEAGWLDGVGMFHVDEIGGFLQTLDKSYNEGGKTILTEWYDCPQEWHKPTRTQGTYYLWKPTVTILGASTLQWLMDNCQESDLMGGFLPRWLFVGHRGGRDYTLALRDRPSEDAYFRVQEEVDRLKAVSGEASLSEGAEGLYWSWRSGFEKDVPERLGGWVNRLGTYGLKLAMIYQAMDQESGLVIGEEAMGFATRFVDSVKEYLAEVVQHDLAFNDDDKDKNKVVKFLRQLPGRQVPHGLALRRSRLPARKFKAVVETLEEAGHLRKVETPRGHAYVWLGD